MDDHSTPVDSMIILPVGEIEENGLIDDHSTEANFVFALNDVWVIKLTEKGFSFNREFFKDDTVDDFSMKFIEILERNFDVKFTKKENWLMDPLRILPTNHTPISDGCVRNNFNVEEIR